MPWKSVGRKDCFSCFPGKKKKKKSGVLGCLVTFRGILFFFCVLACKIS